jgi:hypothetical protein
VIACGMLIIGIWRVTSIADDHIVFSSFIDMSVPRPHRPVSESAEHEPDHEKVFKHWSSIHKFCGHKKTLMNDESHLNLNVLHHRTFTT